MIMKHLVPKNLFIYWHDKHIPPNINKYYNDIISMHPDYNIKLYKKNFQD